MDRGRIVVVGTGTGIGKTYLAVALVNALGEAGHQVAGLKPVESGVGIGVSDTTLLAASSTFHVKQPPPYALEAPVSPHLAARFAGLTIELAPIARWVASVEAAWTVVETAGGLLSPLAPGCTNLDLCAVLEPTAAVLVAPDRLGVLHDVSAALHAWRTLVPQLPEPVIALMAPLEPDGSTGTNADELSALRIATTVVGFRRAGGKDPSTRAAAAGLASLLGAGNGGMSTVPST